MKERGNKIRPAQMEAQPEQELIAYWQHEIEVRKQQVARLTRGPMATVSEKSRVPPHPSRIARHLSTQGGARAVVGLC